MNDIIDTEITEFNLLLNTLPTNNAKNREKRVRIIQSKLESTTNDIKIIQTEILKRVDLITKKSKNKEIESLKEKLSTFEVINELNSFITSYEKMHLDYYLYQLHRYYNEDLSSVNACINKILNSFNTTGIILTEKDFNYHPSILKYMKTILIKSDENTIKKVFDEVYWKTPDFLFILELQFKNLYLKYQKKIDSYYLKRKKEFLASNNLSDLEKAYSLTYNKIKEMSYSDKSYVIEQFTSKNWNLSDFSKVNIDKKINKFFKSGTCDIVVLNSLYNILNELQIIYDYEYLLEDLKTRIDQKSTYKNLYNESIKKIIKLEKKLFALNKKDEKLLKNNKKDDKILFEITKLIKELREVYDSLDDLHFNDIIFTNVPSDISIYEVLKLVSSNYLYFVYKTKEIADDNIKAITDKYYILKQTLNYIDVTFLKTFPLLEDINLSWAICDKYVMDSVTLTPEDLTKDILANTMKDINDLLIYHGISKTNIEVSDISFYLETLKREIKGE